MNYDTIIFIGDASIVRRFNRNLCACFNAHYPRKERRLDNGLIVVVYRVIKTRNYVFNSAQALESIARNTIRAEYGHNIHAGEYCTYVTIEG